MEIKTEQFKFDLGMIAQEIEKHLKEVCQHLLDTGKDLNGITTRNDDGNQIMIVRINPDCSLLVKHYDDLDDDDAFDISLYSIDVYEQLALLDYIGANILER